MKNLKSFNIDERSMETLSRTTRDEGITNKSINDSIIYYGDFIDDVVCPLKEILFSDVIGSIRTSESLKDAINTLRTFPTEKEQNNFKKDRLPFFTFTKYENNNRMNYYESVKAIIFDLDDVGDQLHEIRSRIEKDPWVYAVFISPRGNGLKIICLLDEPLTNQDRYDRSYKYYSEQLNRRLSINLDTTPSYFLRNCFFSYDPEMFVNDQCEKLRVNFDVRHKSINDIISRPKDLNSSSCTEC